jgi:hypothetical protein
VKTVRRLVCGLCGMFLPKLDPETDEGLAFICRCGPDWFGVETEFRVGRRRQTRLPGLPRVKRKTKGLDG